MWKRWLLLVLQVLAVAATTALGIYQYLVPAASVNWRIALAILVVIFACTSLGAYYTFINPVQELNAFVIAVLKTQAQRIVEFAKARGIDIRLNIALVSVFPLQRALPLKRFEIVWDCGMKYAPDVSFTFPVSQGVAGEAYRSRGDRLVNLEIPENRKRWGFSTKAASYFPHFTAIWSLPVYRLGKDNRSTGKICGMLNLDSTTPGAFNVLTAHPAIQKLLEELRELLCKLDR